MATPTKTTTSTTKKVTSTANTGMHFNPVPHNMTRAPRTSWQNYTDSRVGPSGYSTGTLKKAILKGTLGSASTSEVTQILKKTLGSSALGMITTAHLNSPSDTAKQWVASDRPQWGCRFHYNPPGVMIGTDVNDTIDATAISSHQGAALLTSGTSSVSFDLYFNRIFDMVGDPTDYAVPLGKDPATGWSELHMIRSIGTQYDVEFLYRAINGDPQEDNSSLYPTADWGVITAAPVDIQLGPFRWTGMINSLSVTHAMFTPDMVPTLSSVNISLTRQITMQTADSGVKTTTELSAAQQTAINNAKDTKRTATAAQNRELQEAAQSGANVSTGTGTVAKKAAVSGANSTDPKWATSGAGYQYGG